MNYKNFINNDWFDSDSGKTFEVVNPFTEKVIANVPASGKSDIDKAVRAAQVAFKRWSTMTAGGRRDYLQALAQKSLAHADSLAKTISIEMGKPLKDAITKTNQELLTPNLDNVGDTPLLDNNQNSSSSTNTLLPSDDLASMDLVDNDSVDERIVRSELKDDDCVEEDCE